MRQEGRGIGLATLTNKLQEGGIDNAERVPIPMFLQYLDYLATKTNKMGHLLLSSLCRNKTQ
jgi:hypothetical protein